MNHWFKMERPGVFIENGHVTHFTFAVIDIDKASIVANSGHDSKVIDVPFDGVTFDADNGGEGGAGGSSGGAGGAGGSRGGVPRSATILDVPAVSRPVPLFRRRDPGDQDRGASPRHERLAERFVGSARREILDHVIVFDDQHLGRLVAQYKEYFNEARPHQGIGQRIPGKQPAAIDIAKPIVAKPVLGGLHHDYQRAA